MPIAIATDDILELRMCCYHTTTAQLGEMVWHYTMGSVDPGGNLEAFLDVFCQTVGPDIIPVLHSKARFSGASARRVWPTASPSYKTLEGAGVGTGGINPCPDQMAVVLSKRSSVAGRRGRGRCYVPFIPIAFLDANTGKLSDASVGNYAAIVGDIEQRILVDGAGVSYEADGIILNDPVLGTFAGIIRMDVQTRLGSQKRRGNWGRMNPEGP